MISRDIESTVFMYGVRLLDWFVQVLPNYVTSSNILLCAFCTLAIATKNLVNDEMYINVLYDARNISQLTDRGRIERTITLESLLETEQKIMNNFMFVLIGFPQEDYRNMYLTITNYRYPVDQCFKLLMEISTFNSYCACQPPSEMAFAALYFSVFLHRLLWASVRKYKLNVLNLASNFEVLKSHLDDFEIGEATDIVNKLQIRASFGRTRLIIGHLANDICTDNFRDTLQLMKNRFPIMETRDYSTPHNLFSKESFVMRLFKQLIPLKK
ncbi:hypothetical protein SNEBB_001097 [Seison nebaliae]|nr:hypothetical protein SNEBB_001097 [Seison nebaliae]